MEKDRDVQACIRIIKDHPYHWHEDLTIVMVITGEIKLRVWARDNRMRAGDFIVLGPSYIHKLTALTTDNLVVILSFSSALCLEVRHDFPELIIVCNSVQYRGKKVDVYYNFQMMLLELIKAYGMESNHWMVLDKSKKLIEHLCFKFDYLSTGAKGTRYSEHIVARHRLLYQKVFFGDCEWAELSLKDVAKKLDISYTYLRTDILDRFGFGFNWLKYSMMTEKAAHLMLTTDLRLIDISNQCGFSDQKYFRKYTNKFYECTPSKFRKKYKSHKTCEAFIEIPIHHVTACARLFE